MHMRAIDSDTHFLEPLDLWSEYMAPAWRDLAPRLVTDGDRLVLQVEAQVYPAGAAHSGLRSLYREDGSVADGVWELHVASTDAAQRVARMDRTRTDVEVIYPTIGMLGMQAINDPGLAAAHARAYNRYASAMTAAAPDRLHAAMIVPLNHPDEAVEELAFAREQLGLHVLLASFAAPHPYSLSSRELDRLWAAAADLDVAVTFQDSSLAAGARTSGIGRARTWRMLYLAAHVVEAQLGLADLILGGVLERHARLRIGMQETHVRWLPSWLQLLDERFGGRPPGPSPSELFRRQCFVSAFPDEPGVRDVVDLIGAENLVFASDWPHRELVAGTDPDWAAAVGRRADLHADEISRSLVDNPRRWFHLTSR